MVVVWCDLIDSSLETKANFGQALIEILLKP